QSSVVTTSHDCITIIPHFTLNVKHYFHFLFNYFYFFDTFYTKLVCILLALECRIVNSTNLYLTSQQPVNTVIKLHSLDRKSTRLNSSHVSISYAVFCF